MSGNGCTCTYPYVLWVVINIDDYYITKNYVRKKIILNIHVVFPRVQRVRIDNNRNDKNKLGFDVFHELIKKRNIEWIEMIGHEINKGFKEIMKNTFKNITRMNLSVNEIDGYGFSRILKGCCRLNYFNVNGNNITYSQSLYKDIPVNMFMKEFVISENNNFDYNGCCFLLKIFPRVSIIDFSVCDIVVVASEKRKTIFYKDSKYIRKLDICQNEITGAMLFVNMVNSSKKLEILNVSYNKLGIGFTQEMKMKFSKCLTHISISDNEVSTLMFVTIVNTFRKSLKKFTLSRNLVKEEKNLIETIQKNSKLEKLIIDGNSINSKCVRIFLEKFWKLNYIDISCNCIKCDDEFVNIRKHKKLEHLVIRGNQLHSNSLYYILNKFDNLFHLNISQNKIKYDGDFKKIKQNGGLESLSIGYNLICSKALVILLKRITNLTQLDVSRNNIRYDKSLKMLKNRSVEELEEFFLKYNPIKFTEFLKIKGKFVKLKFLDKVFVKGYKGYGNLKFFNPHLSEETKSKVDESMCKDEEKIENYNPNRFYDMNSIDKVTVTKAKKIIKKNKRCFKCDEIASNKCSKCKKIWYCSRKCQINDWKRHQEECES